MLKNEYTQNKIFLHLDRLGEYANGKNVFPIVMETNITNKCNKDCIWCSEKGYRKERCDDTIETEVMIRAINSMGRNKVKSIVFEGGGEPTLHTGLKDMIDASYINNIDVGIITNGILITKAVKEIYKVKFIRISLDSRSPEIFKKLKGTDKFEEVINNIECLANMKEKSKSNTIIGVSYIITEDNINDVENAINICKKVKADYIQFKPEIRNNGFNIIDGSGELINKFKKMYEDDKFNIFSVRLDGTACIDKKDYDYCFSHRFIGAITSNGNVQLCCNLKHKFGDKYIFGNIYDKSLEDIWNSKERKEIISNVENDMMFVKEYCGQCRMDGINRYFNMYNDRESNRLLNFI